MSPDWSAKEEPVPYAKLTDPQTLNLYGYVGNNPLRMADLDGHLETDRPNCIGCFKLPTNPDDVSKNPNWSPDPKFDPYGRARPGTKQWIDGKGNRLRFDPKDPKKKSTTEGGKDHYHYNDGDEHLQPGDEVPEPEPIAPSPPDKSDQGKEPQPDQSGDNQKALKDVGKAGATVGTGYVIYRVLRMLPSLAPPLWWTIPENAAIP